jgi:hypothetical protein
MAVTAGDAPGRALLRHREGCTDRTPQPSASHPPSTACQGSAWILFGSAWGKTGDIGQVRPLRHRFATPENAGLQNILVFA